MRKNHSGEQRSASSEQTSRFGALVRERRRAIGMTQEDLAFATGLGRRFIIELEGGKPTCQLGRALIAASAVGIRVVDILARDAAIADRPDLPDLPPPDLPPDDSEPLP